MISASSDCLAVYRKPLAVGAEKDINRDSASSGERTRRRPDQWIYSLSEWFPTLEDGKQDKAHDKSRGLCVGATYLPGPSPAKYCQQKRAELPCSGWERVDPRPNQHQLPISLVP